MSRSVNATWIRTGSSPTASTTVEVPGSLTVMRPESPRVSLKHRIIREDGVERCVQMAGCTLFDTEAPQRPVCFVGIIADITEDDEESDKAIHHG